MTEEDGGRASWIATNWEPRILLNAFQGSLYENNPAENARVAGFGTDPAPPLETFGSGPHRLVSIKPREPFAGYGRYLQSLNATNY